MPFHENTLAVRSGVLALMLFLAGCRPGGDGGPGSEDGPASPAAPGTSSQPGLPGLLDAGRIGSVDREKGFVTIEARGAAGVREGDFVAVFRGDAAIARLQVFEVDGDSARAKVLNGLAEIQVDDLVKRPREARSPDWPFRGKKP